MTKTRRLFRAIYAGLVFLTLNTLINTFLRIIVFHRVYPIWLSIVDSLIGTLIFTIVVDLLLEYRYKLDVTFKANLGNRRTGEDRRAHKDRRATQDE